MPTSPPVAVVTGGSEGLGRAVTRRLVDRGWRVVVDARRPDVLAATAAALGPDVHAVAGDIADPEHVDELVATARALGPVSLLVNNASTLGASPLPPVADLDPQTADRIFRVNVLAPIELTRRLLADLRTTSGTVVMVSSDAATTAYETWGGYGASKAALAHLAAVLDTEEPDVTAVAIDPGDMRTAMHQAAFPGEDISDRPPPDAAADRIVALVTGVGAPDRAAS